MNGRIIRRGELSVLVLAILAAVALYSLTAQTRPFASAEVQFSDSSAHGLAIIPASCPSDPHFAGDCGVDTQTYTTYIGNIQSGHYTPLPPPPATFTSFTANIPGSSSAGGSSGSSGGAGNGTFLATGALVARPLLLRSGNTTQLYWNVSNAVSCAITGTNGDSWSDMSSGADGKQSSPIIAQTVYTLSCESAAGATPPSIQATQTVTIAPVFQEK